MKRWQYMSIKNAALKVIEDFKIGATKHRVATKVWKYILLNNLDQFTCEKIQIELVGKSIGAGVYEITIKGKK